MANIIFIQGILHPEINSRNLISQLAKRGHHVIFFPSFYFIIDTKKQLALVDKVNEYLDTHEGEFVIIGHSFGGILAHSLKPELYKKISQIITLASPHTGKNPVVLSAISKLPLVTNLWVRRTTVGYYMDTVVPFWDTPHPQTSKHINRIGIHGSLLRGKGEVEFLDHFLT